MANRTVKDARNVHGTNPQYLIEKIIRSRIYDSKFWKEQCFALTAELLVDKAMELRCIGGVYAGNIKPTSFLCLILKMLQIQPEKDIIVEFIKNEEFKYVRALGAFYLRLTATSVDCYKYLEPLYNDNRKLRRQKRDAQYEIVYMDDFIDELLRNERVCDVILPRLQKRSVLEENNDLEPKVSCLDNDLDDDAASDDEKGKSAVVQKSQALEETTSRLKGKERNRERENGDERRDKDRSKSDRGRDRGRDHSRDRSRSRSRSRGRRGDRDKREARDGRDVRDSRDARDSRSHRHDRDYERRQDRHRRDRYDDRRDRHEPRYEDRRRR